MAKKKGKGLLGFLGMGKPKAKAKAKPKKKAKPKPKTASRAQKAKAIKAAAVKAVAKSHVKPKTKPKPKLKTQVKPKPKAKPKKKAALKPKPKPKVESPVPVTSAPKIKSTPHVKPKPAPAPENVKLTPALEQKHGMTRKILQVKPEKPAIETKGLTKPEEDILKAEVKVAKMATPKIKAKKKSKLEVLKVGVSKFDELIGDNGLERGSTVLISGGCGTGKTTFGLQSLYYGATHGEKGIFISFEEEVDKIKIHMKKNYGWDFEALERKGMIKFIQLDPIKVARKVEAARMSEGGELRIKVKPIEMPFVPDRLVVDSLSALSIAFEDEENYRKYIRHLFETFETYHGLTFVLTETEQNPIVYSRAGIEEFLADGVVVLYNIKVRTHRENALEILKLRSSKHEKRLVPYKITNHGVDISLVKKLEHETFV